MKLTAQQVAELVEGKLQGDAGVTVTGAQGVDEADSADVSFISNPKYRDRANNTKAGLLLVPPDLTGLERTVIIVKNPQLAFAKILTILYKERLAGMPSGIHKTAIIAPDAVIGAGVSIGPYCVIENGVRIGARSRIMAQCYIGEGSSVGEDCLIYPRVTMREAVEIGSRVIIHPGTELGSDGFGFVPTGQGIFKIPQIGRVEIGDDVEIGGNVTVDRATTGVTRIGRGTKIDNLVQIAHNVHIGEYCMIVAQTGIAGSTVIGNGVTVAAQAGIAGHLHIGNGVTIAGRAGVTTNLKDKEIVSGFPARPHREDLKLQALLHRLPWIFEQIKKLTNG
jgi:UDP-3-O-[3-hydroxymyristoyl] glucosamine N-acyltransferase